jgi:hypothetical protein
MKRRRFTKTKEKHGMSESPEYYAWNNMLQRCMNENISYWIYYGGRGIKVYPPWIKSFMTFFKYIGKRPTKFHSLDRKNNEKGYFPGNVWWATKHQQMNNRRPSMVIEKYSTEILIKELRRRGIKSLRDQLV